MDTIKLELVKINDDGLLRDGLEFRNILYIKIHINNKDLHMNDHFKDAFLCFDELKKSQSTDGKYLIFTCACGVADDGGWNGVMVKHSLNQIHWNFSVDEVDYSYQFNSKKYVEEINNIEHRLKQDNQREYLEPSNVVFPEQW